MIFPVQEIKFILNIPVFQNRTLFLMDKKCITIRNTFILSYCSLCECLFYVILNCFKSSWSLRWAPDPWLTIIDRTCLVFLYSIPIISSSYHSQTKEKIEKHKCVFITQNLQFVMIQRSLQNSKSTKWRIFAIVHNSTFNSKRKSCGNKSCRHISQIQSLFKVFC